MAALFSNARPFNPLLDALPRKLHVSNWRAFVDMYPAEGLPGVMFSDRPALLVSAHFGNFEMAGYAFGALGFKTSAIARALDNPYLERFVLRVRQVTGQTINVDGGFVMHW